MSSDHDAEFRDFVVARSAALLRVAFLLTGDRGHAEDLLQTALMKTSRRWTHLVDREASYAYVRQVMVNTQTSWLRRRRVVESFVDVVPDSAANLDDFHASEAETARLLGCSAGTVKGRRAGGCCRNLGPHRCRHRGHDQQNVRNTLPWITADSGWHVRDS